MAVMNTYYWENGPWVGYGYVTHGGLVRAVQEMLVASGCDVGPSGFDGLWGPATESALKKFQSQENITADGIVGPQTWSRFWNYLVFTGGNTAEKWFEFRRTGSPIGYIPFAWWVYDTVWSYMNIMDDQMRQYIMDDGEHLHL